MEDTIEQNSQQSYTSDILVPMNADSQPTTPTPARTNLTINPPKPSSTNSNSALPKTPLTPSIPPALPSPAPSLTSTRPAPPSPAVSRRASQAPSTASGSGTGSRTNSRRNSRRTSGLRDSLIRNQHRASLGLATIQPSAASISELSQRILTIKIRDFAFRASDDRHCGLGPDEDVPKANRVKYLLRVLNAHLRDSKVSTASRVEEDDWDEDDSWDDPLDDGEYEGEYEQDEEEAGPLLPGLYRALYAFTPEGPTERALEEGEIVTVLGRGGGNGWAVVIEASDGDDNKVRHALVPESYLELVEVQPEAS